MSDDKTLPAERARAFSLAPTTCKEAQEFAALLAQSDMVPKDYRGKPGNCLVAMQMGMELGLPITQAIQNIAVINGRPALWGDGVLAVIVAHPSFLDIVERIEGQGEAAVAVCTVTRRGREAVTRTFGVADAKRAGLWGKQGPWAQYPSRMLQMRARGFACRDAFPDALRGIHLAEEAGDIVEREVAGEVLRGKPVTRAPQARLPDSTGDAPPAIVESHTENPEPEAATTGDPAPDDAVPSTQTVIRAWENDLLAAGGMDAVNALTKELAEVRPLVGEDEYRRMTGMLRARVKALAKA